MSTTTLNNALGGTTSTSGRGVLDLFTSLKNLIAGIFGTSTTCKSITAPVPRSAFEEAEDLRAYAERFLATDEAYALDLFAAADRHERAAKP